MTNNLFAHIDAIIFDLDGVITTTRTTHKKAWENMFRLFFEENFSRQPPLSENDYQLYIDGKPRYDGVKSFLNSRGISLPWGSPDDVPGFHSICGLGNIKNRLFHSIIEAEGVKVYDDAVEKLRYWRDKGIKTAIVSSSRNCEIILTIAGLDKHFETRVDGVTLEEMGLKGKPHPDMFLEAASRLEARPSHTVVFEDAVSGVMAAQNGFFGLVVGVNRFDNREKLLENGADIVIDNFETFDIAEKTIIDEYFSLPAHPVFPENKDLFKKLKQNKPAIFLDYDGTLTPIVAKPHEAVLSVLMKETLSRLAKVFTVAIVTGRDKEDVEDLVEIPELIYAGSHGYIITGPDNLFMEHPESEKIIPELDKIEKEAGELLRERTKGTQLDRKRYAIGLHYRNARPEDEKEVREIVDFLLDKYPGHKKGEGKKIIEIKPDTDWHKGRAVEWIMKTLGLYGNGAIPMFIGDDVTDEDAFSVIRGEGIGILVGNHGNETQAEYSLKNVFQVRLFFEKLISIYAGNPKEKFI
jgi:trehalose 6-phosphate phosphatase